MTPFPHIVPVRAGKRAWCLWKHGTSSPVCSDNNFHLTFWFCASRTDDLRRRDDGRFLIFFCFTRRSALSVAASPALLLLLLLLVSASPPSMPSDTVTTSEIAVTRSFVCGWLLTHVLPRVCRRGGLSHLPFVRVMQTRHNETATINCVTVLAPRECRVTTHARRRHTLQHSWPFRACTCTRTHTKPSLSNRTCHLRQLRRSQ